MAPSDDPGFTYDAALSFAGPDREYVEEVAAAMKAAELRIFIDSDHEAEMWGEDLVEFFERTFNVDARYLIAPQDLRVGCKCCG